jgi:AraC-like DNA-binding protein
VRYAEREPWREPMSTRSIFDHEFIYVIKGWVRAEWAGRKTLMVPGDLWVVEPGEPHAGVPEPRLTEIFGVHYDYVTLRDSHRISYPMVDHVRLPAPRDRATFPGGLVLSGVYRAAVLPDLRAPFARLVQAYQERRPADVLRVRARWMELFYLLVWALSGGPARAGSLAKHRRQVEKALGWIEANFAGPFDRNHLAKLVNLSPSHLTHLFRRLTGRSPLQHVQHLRMSEAKRLLREGTMRVQEIGRRVGYEDPYHFSRAFKKHEGFSPRAYGEMIRRR